MSSTTIQDPAAGKLSSGSGQTFPCLTLLPTSDPSASKRLCFYKSGDYKFSGHRMVINGRTFKTFDALLDTLSRKVPLPFGVRTITTPRGIHLVKGLDDFHDGGSYVCSDQKRVKPLNLAEVNRRQVPWNTTRPVSTGRRRRIQFGQFGRRKELANRPAKVTDRVTLRTPKRLVVIKNKDPTVKSTIVLQRRTAPTFDALLDYLSQILQFPVLKLFSTDGRRVDGLAALILCSGVVVAAGNEPFKLGNNSFNRGGQTAQALYMENLDPSMLQPRTHNNKSFSSGRGSRNFSLSSERYVINQINKSRDGSMNGRLHHHNESFDTEVNQRGRGENEHHTCVIPQDDDIEKSFRVNQDGSMTVEMKVRLTIKEEEILHWTTTLSRHCLSKRTVCASISESANSSPDSNNAVAKDSSSISEGDSKEENHANGAGRGVCFDDNHKYKNYNSKALGRDKTIKRTPTPGPRHVKKTASVESVKMVTESGIQESRLGHYSYMEKTADGETTEGYCVVRHSSSSSSRPIPKPRKTASAGKGNKGSHSSIRSSGVAEVLQIQNNGMKVTETVMHIYEGQGGYDNYSANEEYSADGAPLHGSTSGPNSKASTGPRSSSNDCDIDFSRQPPTADSIQLREEMLSLSSEPISPTHEITNNLPTVTEDDAQTAANSQIEDTVKRDKTPKSEKTKKKMTKPAVNQKSSTSKSSKNSTDKLSSNTSVGKKSLGSSESAKIVHKRKEAENKEEKLQSKKTIKVEKKPRKSSALLNKTESVKITPPKRQSLNKVAARDNGHNVNTPSGRPQMKKNISDILQPKRAPLLSRKTIISKPKSMTENRTSSPKKSLETSKSISNPSLNPTPSEIHQYVENWLETVGQEQAPYTEAIPEDSEPPSTVVFQIGGGSESDEKNGHQNNLAEYIPLSGDNVKKSASCLTVPLYKGEPEASLLHSVSMPSVRVDPAQQDNQLRAHKSAEAIGPTGCESTSTSSNILTPKEKLTPVLRQLCSSIQNIRRASDTNTTYNLDKSNSLPDFSTQVASVFGSSCKALLSFLSVMTLRDDLAGSAPNVCDQSRSTSEAMLMMQSLMKISAIEDKEELSVSLSNLQSSTSSQFRERWKDFQILRERLEIEPLSDQVSETEFALDLDSEGGDIVEDQHLTLDELMEELNMPQDLKSEISSTIHQARSFYPPEESTMVETERNQSDSEEDLEKFVDESKDEAKSADSDDTRAEENFAERKMDTDDGDRKSDQEADEVQELGSDLKDSEVSQTEQDEALKDEEDEDKVEEDRKDKKAGEDGEMNETNDDGKEEEAMEDVEGQKAENGSVEESVDKEKEGTEEEMTADEDEEREKLEEGGEGVVEETVGGLLDEKDLEEREYNSIDETEERESVDETKEEERGGMDGVEEEADEEVKAEEGVDHKEKDENIFTEYDVEEELEKVIEETEEEEEVENILNMEEEVDVVSEDFDEEADQVREEKDEEDLDNVAEEVDEEEDEEDNEEEEKEEEKERKLVWRESNEEEEEEEDDDAEVEEERVITDKSVEENEVQEFETEVEREDDKENEGSDQVEKQVSKEEVEEGDVSEDVDSFEGDTTTNLLEEASYLQQSSNEQANAECNSESPTKYSSEGQCEFTKGSGTDNELETDEGGERREENSLIHPVEISQELLDFVNSALQSSSLTFSYDARGNIRIEPDHARVVQTMPTLFPNRRKDSSYGLKRLPSPNTSDLSDYRPETSESGGYKTQESVDLVSESGEEASERSSPALTPENDLLSLASTAEVLQSSRIKSEESFSSNDSGTKASKEDLSYFSAASSLKGDAEAAPEATQPVSLSSEKDTGDGVLIDQGRWLLKENHLIRKSPPVALGMYGNMDSTSTDTGQENAGEDSPLHHKTQPDPLVDISTSELEDMAKPPTPKCTYYNMPHGSDSDPFLDNYSGHSVKKDTSRGMGRSFRVSPSIDTSETWPNKIGSPSSFKSVEFRLPDGRIHPEGEAPVVTQPRRTSSGGSSALQAQNSPETLLVRCGQYCPIL